MNEGRPLNNGEKHNDFPLVRRPSSAVEKVAPGAKRILSGMVADTLALVKKTRPPRIVVVDDEQVLLDLNEMLIRKNFKDAVVLTFDDSEKAWQELLRADPDLLITDHAMPALGGEEIVRRLADRKATYPIIVLSSWGEIAERWVRENANRGLNIKLLDVPFGIESFLKAVEDSLKIPRDIAGPDAMALPVVADAYLENWFQTGEKYYFGQGVPKDYAEALNWFRKAAEHGHALAQNSVGVCYEKGRGVPQDCAEAVKWYRKAAEQGEAYAQNNLGACYANGEGVSMDRAEAVKWYRKAAEQGNVLAKTNLGLLNEKGDGVPDYPEAAESCRKMAEQGYAPAQHNLGVCYLDGKGVERDYEEAVKWFRKAAEQGHLAAQESLGACYANGRAAIAIENAVDAYKYVKLAEEKGYEGAAKTVYVVSELLSPEELREAERRYQELKSRRSSSNTELANVFQTGLPETRTRYEDAEATYQKFRTNHDLGKYDYARSLLRKAAAMGHTEAMYDCGIDYMSGDGCPQDNKQAFYWIRKAAEKDYAFAQFHLGVIYKAKIFPGYADVLQDLPEAYKWFKLAAEHGYNNGARSLALLSSTMTSDQLQEGERRYREFRLQRK